jgi:hypothetical protein
MDGKIERVCIKFYMKLDKSGTETIKILRKAFGVHPLCRSAVFFIGIRISSQVECELKIRNVQGDQSEVKQQKMLKIFDNLSMDTVAELSISLQTLFGSVTEFPRRF